MKNRLLMILIPLWVVTFSQVCRAQTGEGSAPGVGYFSRGDVYDALESASSQRKLLLVEVHAPWNYRSNWMHDMMSRSELVRRTIADDFVIFRQDTQTPEGAKFAQTYEVTNYPCILIFNAKGDVVEKLDKNLDPQDFVEFLSRVRFNQDGSTLWRIRQVTSAAENGRTDDADVLFRGLVARAGEDIFSKEYWDLYENSSLTYYYTASYGHLLNHYFKFKSLVGDHAVEAVVLRALKRAISPYLLAGREVDTMILADIEKIAAEYLPKDQYVPLAADLIRARLAGSVSEYLFVIRRLLAQTPEQETFALVLTLDWAEKSAYREQKVAIKAIVQDQMLRTSIPTQVNILLGLMEKF